MLRIRKQASFKVQRSQITTISSHRNARRMTNSVRIQRYSFDSKEADTVKQSHHIPCTNRNESIPHTKSKIIRELVPSMIEIRHDHVSSTFLTLSSPSPKIIDHMYHYFVAAVQMIINYVYTICCGIVDVTSNTLKLPVEVQSSFRIRCDNELTSPQLIDASFKSNKNWCCMDHTLDYSYHGRTNRYGKQDYTIAEKIIREHFVHPSYLQHRQQLLS